MKKDPLNIKQKNGKKLPYLTEENLKKENQNHKNYGMISKQLYAVMNLKFVIVQKPYKMVHKVVFIFGVEILW